MNGPRRGFLGACAALLAGLRPQRFVWGRDVVTYKPPVDYADAHGVLDRLHEIIRRVYRYERTWISPRGADGRFYARLYTKTHQYTITAKPNYLGCTMCRRACLPGEDWQRGRDLADGPCTWATWCRITEDMARTEDIGRDLRPNAHRHVKIDKCGACGKPHACMRVEPVYYVYTGERKWLGRCFESGAAIGVTFFDEEVSLATLVYLPGEELPAS